MGFDSTIGLDIVECVAAHVPDDVKPTMVNLKLAAIALHVFDTMTEAGERCCFEFNNHRISYWKPSEEVEDSMKRGGKNRPSSHVLWAMDEFDRSVYHDGHFFHSVDHAILHAAKDVIKESDK